MSVHINEGSLLIVPKILFIVIPRHSFWNVDADPVAVWHYQ